VVIYFALSDGLEVTMKTDRFMKWMLVIIALLLALNCASGIRTPPTDNSTEAAAPPRFLQQGKVYHMRWVALEETNPGAGGT
jgi:hypothetical protein